MNVESLTASALVGIVSHAQNNGKDVHAVLLVIDNASGEHSLKAMQAQGGPALCCAGRAVFRQFLETHPDVGRLLAAEIADVLSAMPAGAVN